jgi:hypothetical protein
MGKASPKPDKQVAPTSATRYRVLKNGAVYDNEVKHIVGNSKELAVVDTQITPATAGAMLARKQELKRERIQAGANAVVAGMGSVLDGQVFKGEGLDWVQAIAEQVAIKAHDPDNPKQVDAARFLLQEAGIAEQKQAAEQPAAGGISQDALDKLYVIAQAALASRQQAETDKE